MAALIAGENASYAPDLDIVGVAALAPANPATFLIPEISQQSTGGPRTGRNILLVRAYTWAYPDLQLSDLLTDIGIEAAEAASRQGIQQLAISADAAGGLPVLVMQGTVDNIVPQASTDLYVSEACKSSSRVSYIKYPQIDHRGLLKAAESDFTTWIASRFANEPAPSDCQ
ncbi:lipase family protein [Nostoc sp. XA010]|uniref:lipase family protein n=1 Tax=Nostoc sp. XA010 TaxID=2780407 RepID=UPI001E4D1708|nr:lipase family protein [Nostoc sp. XA010]MCC5661583.1 lipase family protein [Nostoc sp. XA010]